MTHFRSGLGEGNENDYNVNILVFMLMLARKCNLENVDCHKALNPMCSHQIFEDWKQKKDGKFVGEKQLENVS